MIHLLFVALTAWPGPLLSSQNCASYGFKGYTYQKRVNGEEQFYNSLHGITLRVRCHPPDVTFEQIVNKLKLDSGVRNTTGDAVYFESNERGIFKRVYVVERKPVVQLTFSARRKNRAFLNKTQALIEKYYKKSKIKFSK